MKNKKLLLILTVLLYCMKLFSQESIVFDKQYLFDNQGSYIRDVKQTADSGFICAGGIGFGIYDDRYLLFKTDSLGNIEWYKYSDSSAVHSTLWAVDITKTGGYVGVGTTQDNPDWHESGAIVMYNADGDTLWTKQYAFEHPSIDGLYSMINFYDGIFTSDNSIVAAGSIIDDNLSSDPNPIVVKTNMEGDTVWTWRLNNTDNLIVLKAIVETDEGDYVAVGRADMPILYKEKTYAPQRGFIVKLSSDGELIYLKEWTDIEFNYFTDLAINNNGELVISGCCSHHPPEYPDDEHFGFVLKTDSYGNTIFFDIIEYGIGLDGLNVNVSFSNEIIFLGYFAVPLSLDWKHDVLLKKYSNNGDVIWSKNIGVKDAYNWPYSVISTNDNGIAFCGLYSPETGNYSWLVKTDSLGNGVYNVGWINSVNQNMLVSEISIYPNPAQEVVNFSIPFDYSSFTANILTLEGKEIKAFDETDTFLYIGDLSKGIYLVRIAVNNQIFYQKLVINR